MYIELIPPQEWKSEGLVPIGTPYYNCDKHGDCCCHGVRSTHFTIYPFLRSVLVSKSLSQFRSPNCHPQRSKRGAAGCPRANPELSFHSVPGEKKNRHCPPTQEIAATVFFPTGKIVNRFYVVDVGIKPPNISQIGIFADPPISGKWMLTEKRSPDLGTW